MSLPAISVCSHSTANSILTSARSQLEKTRSNSSHYDSKAAWPPCSMFARQKSWFTKRPRRFRILNEQSSRRRTRLVCFSATTQDQFHEVNPSLSNKSYRRSRLAYHLHCLSVARIFALQRITSKRSTPLFTQPRPHISRGLV